MSNDRTYYGYNKCIQPIQPTMTVCQLVGQRQAQESLDLHVRVPRNKPAIEQVIDVYVKKLKITSIDVICDKVVVRGKFEVKVLYVACKPEQPVHAVEMHNVRFTTYVDLPGVRPGMDAEATVRAEFVDYDCDPRTRAGWYKKKAKWEMEHKYDCEPEDWDEEDCEEDCCEEQCDPCDCKPPKKHKKKPCKPPKPCKPVWDDCHMPKKCSRQCHVSVVLQVVVKAFAYREILVYQGGLPVKPKG